MISTTDQNSFQNINKKQWNTIVIGGAQAGLAAAYYLKKNNDDFIVLDAGKRVGDSWRFRWDSLTLFTPREFNVLPGWSYPAIDDSAMTKDEMADYLQQYATRFSLPVRVNTRVHTLLKESDRFLVRTTDGEFICNHVIVASGTHQRPYIPSFANQLDPRIHSLHASEYRNPSQLPIGKVLVVGSATSGIEIAMEIAATTPVMLAGKPSFVIPKGAFRFGRRFYWWFINNILSIKTPVGRKVRPGIIKGGAVLPHILEKLKDSEVLRLPRVTNVQDGMPVLEDGQKLQVSTVIWCTGYRPDFSWIRLKNVIGDNRWPITKRGVCAAVAGLYFVGMPFQFALASGLVGGVGRDAKYVVDDLVKQSVKTNTDSMNKDAHTTPIRTSLQKVR